jgi:hypothetical protein
MNFVGRGFSRDIKDGQSIGFSRWLREIQALIQTL